MKLCFLFLLSACAFAQSVTPNRRLNFQPVAVSAASYSPTNIAGVTNLSWWVADGQALTNASGQLSNWLDAGVSPKNLTNTAASSTWPYLSNNVVNGHAFVHFVKANGTYLRNAAYTSSQPHEVSMVVRWMALTNGIQTILFDGVTSYNLVYQDGSGRFVLYAGNSPVVSTFNTNKWIVINALFNGASSGLWTNNISRGAINAGTQTSSGFALAIASNLTGPAPIQVAEIVTYRGTLGAVDSAGTFSVAEARSNLFVYLTNKYGITP